jgi:hypothetical protein
MMRFFVLSLMLFSFVPASFSYAGVITRRLQPGERVVGPKCKKNFDEKFRQAAVDALKQAQSNGYRGYRNVNFEKLQAQIESKDINIGCWPKNVEVNYTGKTGATYRSDLQTINLNYVMQDESINPESFAIMAIHEHLGAFGYDDREGELSLAIVFMSQHVNDNLDLLPYDEVLMKLALAGEGGTSTGSGGGGDPYQLSIKYSLFKLFYKEVAEEFKAGQINLSEAQRQLRRFLDIKVEYWVAQRRFEEPKFEIMQYTTARGTCNSTLRAGMGITVGAEFINKATTENFSTFYAYLKSLAQNSGETPRCLE